MFIFQQFGKFDDNTVCVIIFFSSIEFVKTLIKIYYYFFLQKKNWVDHRKSNVLTGKNDIERFYFQFQKTIHSLFALDRMNE